MKEKLKSRKLWIAIGGVLTVVLTDWASLSPELADNLVTGLVTIVVAYVGGQSIVDAAKEAMVGKDKSSETHKPLG
tara:strand:+ start:290 stop:517 length:228 start_codon:yes stop_codon:yes gene_type:complete